VKIETFVEAALDLRHRMHTRRLQGAEIAVIAFAIGTLFGIFLALAVRQVWSY
jgi:hypothetical protein